MGTRYGKFELPSKIKINKKKESENVVYFIAEPFSKGFGHTLGNALRRIMLSSLEAPAIISFKMEGVSHEYMAIPGIIEDMTHIILNLKLALFRKLPSDQEKDSKSIKILVKTLEVTPEMLESSNGQYVVRLKDIIDQGYFEIVNPELEIFSVTRPMTKRIEIKIGFGRGYVSSDQHRLDKVVDGEIVMDSAFSPVRLVNYQVGTTRIGQTTDYDRLVLKVQTDGRITPLEALIFAAQIANAHFKVFEEESFLPLTFETEEEKGDTDKDVILSKLATRIDEIELSVRSTHCLERANIETVGELIQYDEQGLLRFRNFGRKSLNEIKQKIEEFGFQLGLDLTKYGITKENVKQVMSEYKKNKLGKES